MSTQVLGEEPSPEERDGAAVSHFETIGRYRVLQELGQGGMGVVHLALDERGRAVAVKVLRPHVAADEDARARLGREVETLARVRSERIAPVFDADLDSDRPYIVTRYVPGPSLDHLVREEGPLDPQALLSLARGLVEALRAIHRVGVVHRDLKPGNVLMLDGDPVVIDFGIAHVAESSRMTMTGLVMGTPGYLSPELVEGGEVTPATDWWGWAATLAFAATGRPPFGRGGMETVLARVCRGEADLRDVDPQLAPLLYACFDPDASRRPESGEVLDALEAWAHGRPVTEVLPERTRTLEQGATRVLAPVAVPVEPVEPPAPWGEGDWRDPNPLPPTPAPAPAPEAAPTPWPTGTDPDRPGDPRIGRPRRTDVLGGVLAVLVALGAAAPWVGLAAALLWSWSARTIDHSMTSTVRRRHRAGRRRSDGIVAAVASPWHLLTAALQTVVTALLPLAVGAAAVLAAALGQAAVDGQGVRLGSPPALVAGALLALLVGWWGPGGPSLRRGSRSLARSVTGVSVVRRVLVVVLVVLAVGTLGALVAGAIDVSWWPGAASPLPGPQQLPGR